MAYQQMATLHLRGTLANKTLKNLTPTQTQEIENIILQAYHDPNLQSTKNEFCNALARTIKNDYTHREAAEQEYLIALTRAAVAAKHGYGKKEPAPMAITDPHQRTKWFKNWAFNYLKQILRENKLPTRKTTTQTTLPADKALIYITTQLIQQTINTTTYPQKQKLQQKLNNIQITQNNNIITLHIDHWTYPPQLTQHIQQLHQQHKHHTHITLTENGIQITPQTNNPPLITITQTTKTHIQTNPIPENHPQHRRPQTMDEQTIQNIKKHLPENTKPILDILYEPTRPQAYTNKYGHSKPKATHIAQYLGTTPREIKKHLTIIKHHILINTPTQK
jgi:hypothetical protein